MKHSCTPVLRAAALVAAVLGAGPAMGQEPRTNAFGDPFGPVTRGHAGCPEPAGPLFTREEARRETHWRAERGNSCFRSGRCRLPNGYLYDAEIFPRAVKFILHDGRFDDTSLWLTVQRRWITVQGCVRSPEQALALEAGLRSLDDVEAVIPQLRVAPEGPAPYETK